MHDFGASAGEAWESLVDSFVFAPLKFAYSPPMLISDPIYKVMASCT